MTGNFTSILNLYRLLYWLIDKDIAEIDLLLSEIGLWTQSFSFEFERKSLLCAGNVAVGHAVVGVSLSWHECHCDSNFTVRPDLSQQRLYFEDIILEKEKIVFNGFSNSFVFACQSQLGSLLLPLC